MKGKLCILTHLYYEESWEEFVPYFRTFPYQDTYFFFNLSLDNANARRVIRNIRAMLPKAICTITSNIGKDIGAKLHLLDLAKRLDMIGEFTLFLHDKKSPHTATGSEWRTKLMKIAEKEKFKNVCSIFLKNQSAGIVASKDFIRNEYNSTQKDFSCTSNEQIKQSLSTYNIQPGSYDFVAGTMFWARTSALGNFFSLHSPLSIRSKLEKGNVLDHANGSHTHAWERILAWLYTRNGYKICGV